MKSRLFAYEIEKKFFKGEHSDKIVYTERTFLKIKHFLLHEQIFIFYWKKKGKQAILISKPKYARSRIKWFQL